MYLMPFAVIEAHIEQNGSLRIKQCESLDIQATSHMVDEQVN